MAIDNVNIDDANGLAYKLRSKDVSTAQDGTLQRSLILSSAYPVDYGAGGSFQLTSRSGLMAAGLAAFAPIYSFRWPSATFNALVRRVRIQAWTVTTGFTAGVAEFDIVPARSWTVGDTGGTADTITAPNGKMRASMGATLLAEVRHSTTATLTAGTRTLWAQIMDITALQAPTTANTLFVPYSARPLFERQPHEHPLLLVQNEGFIIQTSVPATGVWAFTVTTEWDEVPLVNF